MKDRGHAGIELAVAVAVLLLPVALVVTGFGPWSERRVAAEAAAAEAARAAVLELSLAAGASAVASTLGEESVESARIGWCGAAPAAPMAGGCSMSRGSVVAVRVELWSPLVVTPWGSIGGLWVVGEHSEPIDLYRSLG